MLAIGDVDYETMHWTDSGQAVLKGPGTFDVEVNTNEILFLRLRTPSTCTKDSYALYAFKESGDDVPLVFDHNNVKYNPRFKTTYWWVKSGIPTSLKTLTFDVHGVDGENCAPRIAVSSGMTSVPPGGNTFFSRGFGESDVAEYIAVDIAQGDMRNTASAHCGLVSVAEVPGKTFCSVRGIGHHFSAECHGYFTCIK